MPGDQKIFCIGFNKTGTTSLHDFFQQLGLASRHDAIWAQWSHLLGPKGRFDGMSCFSDGEQASFVNLDRWFPGSVFVLNRRALRPWLRSRVKHVMRFGHPETFSGAPPKHFGPMARAFFADEGLAIDRWILERAHYHTAARAYFAGQRRFLEVDVTSAPNWQEQLLGAMTDAGLSPPVQWTGERRISNTRRAQDLTDQARLGAYFDLIDTRIAALSQLRTLDEAA